jgi:hypothetical protein
METEDQKLHQPKVQTKIFNIRRYLKYMISKFIFALKNVRQSLCRITNNFLQRRFFPQSPCNVTLFLFPPI